MDKFQNPSDFPSGSPLSSLRWPNLGDHHDILSSPLFILSRTRAVKRIITTWIRIGTGIYSLRITITGNRWALVGSWTCLWTRSELSSTAFLLQISFNILCPSWSEYSANRSLPLADPRETQVTADTTVDFIALETSSLARNQTCKYLLNTAGSVLIPLF
jgi:hypothetical protein